MSILKIQYVVYVYYAALLFICTYSIELKLLDLKLLQYLKLYILYNLFSKMVMLSLSSYSKWLRYYYYYYIIKKLMSTVHFGWVGNSCCVFNELLQLIFDIPLYINYFFLVCVFVIFAPRVWESSVCVSKVVELTIKLQTINCMPTPTHY